MTLSFYYPTKDEEEIGIVIYGLASWPSMSVLMIVTWRQA
jgi:hypothetical protein